MIDYVPSREAGVSGGGGIQGTPEEMAVAREGNRWLRETAQGRASMQEVVDYVTEMVRADRARGRGEIEIDGNGRVTFIE